VSPVESVGLLRKRSANHGSSSELVLDLLGRLEVRDSACGQPVVKTRFEDCVWLLGGGVVVSRPGALLDGFGVALHVSAQCYCVESTHFDSSVILVVVGSRRTLSASFLFFFPQGELRGLGLAEGGVVLFSEGQRREDHGCIHGVGGLVVDADFFGDIHCPPVAVERVPECARAVHLHFHDRRVPLHVINVRRRNHFRQFSLKQGPSLSFHICRMLGLGSNSEVLYK